MRHTTMRAAAVHPLVRPPRPGWAAYLWLLYLPGVFVAPVLDHAGTAVWMCTIGGVLAFVPLYLYAYVLHGRRPLYGVIARIASIGVLLVPINGSAGAFLVYAASVAGTLQPVRHAAMVVVLLVGLAAVEALLVHQRLAIWAGESVFIALVGAANAHLAAAQNVAAALERAREEIAHLAVVRERERIAHDLHDVLGHTLSLIALKASLAERLAQRSAVPADDQARAVQHELAAIGDIARAALDEVRGAVAGYRASGLAYELAAARRMLVAAGVRTEVVEWTAVLTDAEDAQLALILREAVTNVARHAQASCCMLRLTDADGVRLLEVCDDGVGGRAPTGASGGIGNMHARAAALAGALAITAGGAGRGWRLIVTLPASDRQVDARVHASVNARAAGAIDDAEVGDVSLDALRSRRSTPDVTAWSRSA